MKRLATLLASLAVALALTGCSSGGSSSDAPSDFTVTAGDASVTATWTAVAGVEYWIFYAQGENVTTSNWVSLNGRVLTKATSPQVITGLLNGTTYSFTINARKDGGPGGAGSPTVVATPRLSGNVWAPGPAIASERLAGITAGNVPDGVANVAVATSGAIYLATNSGAYASQANPQAANGLNAVTYSSPGYVAAGGNGTVLQSVDGKAWTAVTSNTSQALLGAAAAGFGNYIVVGANGTIITSANGTDWTARDSGSTRHLRAVTYGGAQYLAVGDAGTILASANAAAWVAAPALTSAGLRGVAHAALANTASDGTVSITNVYVAVGEGGTLLTSNDGAAWTVRAPLGSANLNAVIYGGQFVAVGDGGAIFTSPDGITWTARVSGTTRNLTALVRSLTGYLVVGDGGASLISN